MPYPWKNEITQLRLICESVGLKEERKWGKPCFTSNDKNIVIIQPFKEYLALLFFKGYLMDDPEGILQKTGQNTRVGRQIRFHNAEEINQQREILKKYIKQAIKAELSGDIAEPLEKKVVKIPEELHEMLKQMPDLNKAFHLLTPGRQRAYIFYFSQPKQSKTRISRIEKYIPDILQGKGLND
jgi:uncharacterized protein YdeI (YjbR/CyaY-like superfamily)